MRVSIPPQKESAVLGTRQKALAVNLDPRRYGTFAEIGAGQEVVRWFFRAGGAAGTIAKSISAYDMAVSDAIYGRAERYVCRPRLQAMLDYEHRLNLERLKDARGSTTAFFTFADTVSARNFKGTNECHGWMGVKFQAHPRDQDSQIILHVRMLDGENSLQAEALGIVGVNLLYGAFFHAHEPVRLLESLLDNLSTQRIEIDMMEFSGIEFRSVDNRVVSLKLVQLGLTGAAMFGPDGQVLQPSEVLYKRPVLVERGSFRPVTHVNMDMLRGAREQFGRMLGDERDKVVELMEITMRNLLAGGEIDYQDFLARADVLAAAGKSVLISDYFEYYRLVRYFHRYTLRPIAIVLGARSLLDIFDEKYYSKLDGGILEAIGKTFRYDTKLFVYPYRDAKNGGLLTVKNLNLAPELAKLYGYLVDRGCIVDIETHNPDYLGIFSRDVARRIQAGDASWERDVPAEISSVIKQRGFFGFRRAEADSEPPG
ncbi:MAG TPA: hypothetical protein VGK73_33440 [Polyangiaceae bacterium]